MDTLSYWSTLWSEKKTGWHRNEVNPILLKHSSKFNLLPSSLKRVFVPLCGKSLDLKWLYDQGHEVVGVEGIEEPVKDFFEQHNIPYTQKGLGWAKIYQNQDGRLKVYVCNIYNLRPDEVGKFNVFWDKGSFVAIYPEDRQRYVQLMQNLFAPSFVYLLATLQYDGVDINGATPRCIPHRLTEQLFGSSCTIKLLDDYDLTHDLSRNLWGLAELRESVHLLTPK